MKIKICGLTNTKEAEYLNTQQIDFAGMVMFFPKSRRNITCQQAQEIIKALKPEIKKVAVVVSPDVEQICQIEEAGFDYIQVHDTLSEEVLAKVGLPIWKAFRTNQMDQYSVFSKCPKVAGYVFDAQEPGSGKVTDWSQVKEYPRDGKLCLLAGGLNPENVSEAIRFVQPDGVDVSSGVEYDDGRLGKDFEKIARFVEAVRGEERQ